MKYETIAALMFAGASAREQSAQKYVSITEGFLMGAIKAEGFTDIEHCIQDGEAIIQDAESAYSHFSQGDISDILDGVKDVADAIKQIQAAMKDCSQMKADWAKLEKMAMIFEHPVSFSWHIAGDIIHNGVKITKEVDAGVEDYKQGNWYDFGLQFGEAAAQVFLGSESQEYLKQEAERQKLAKFFEGFLKAFGIEFHLEDFLVCVQFEDQALLALDLATEAFKKAIHDTDAENMIGDLIGTGMAIRTAYAQFEHGLPWCERVTGKTIDVTPASSAMDFISKPSNMGTMTYNLMKFKDELKDDAMSAIFYANTEQFDKFGEFLGNIIRVMSEHEAKQAEDNNLFLY